MKSKLCWCGAESEQGYTRCLFQCSGFDGEEVSRDWLPFSSFFAQQRPLTPSLLPLTSPPNSPLNFLWCAAVCQWA